MEVTIRALKEEDIEVTKKLSLQSEKSQYAIPVLGSPFNSED